MHLESDFQIAPNLPKIGKIMMVSYYSDIVKLFDIIVLLFLILDSSPFFMSISLLVMQLRQYLIKLPNNIQMA